MPGLLSWSALAHLVWASVLADIYCIKVFACVLDSWMMVGSQLLEESQQVMLLGGSVTIKTLGDLTERNPKAFTNFGLSRISLCFQALIAGMTAPRKGAVPHRDKGKD